MKNFRKYMYPVVALALTLGAVSCTDYLDKAPEVDLSEKDAFADFRSFQGFTEEIYGCIPDFCKLYWNNSFNWGEDEIMPENRQRRLLGMAERTRRMGLRMVGQR